jgi:hypothetical protein
MCIQPQVDHDLFRVLLYRKRATELLLETSSSAFRLPFVPVPARTRVAQELLESIKTSWNLETYCLFTLPSEISSKPAVRYVVLEDCLVSEQTPPGMQWLGISALCEKDFGDSDDLAAIQSSLVMFDRYSRGELPGAFGVPGSCRMVTAWIEQQAAAAGLHPSGTFRQLNGGPTFSLIRFETDGPALWFKAVGEPNLREYDITLELGSAFTNFVPQILATRREWNAWLATEVEGSHPDNNSVIDVWTTVVRQIAELQIASFGQALHLINVGCHDLRISSLVEMIDPFMEVMAALMQQQTKTSPAPLSQRELSGLGTQLHDALAILNDSGIPNVLNHLDLNPRNILVSVPRCVFLDWAQAAVGHPLLTFQYLLDHLRRLRSIHHGWQQTLVTAYVDVWRFTVEPNFLIKSLDVAPLLSVFAHAVAQGAWRMGGTLCGGVSAGYLRSLARRMKLEADAWSTRQCDWNVPCRN